MTLEAITGRPPRTAAGAPIWAPDGKRFVYRQGDRIMLYDAAAKSARELLQMRALTEAAVKVPPETRFNWENRRTREQPIQWMPAGDGLLILAGNDLFLWHLETGKHEQLTATPEAERDPKASPDGRFVSFLRDHDLWVLDLASKKETQVTSGGTDTLRNGELDWVYPEELNLGTAYWWSPDSRSIAYMQFDVIREPLYPHADLQTYRPILEPQRYPQAGEPNAGVLVGVVPAAGGVTRWMDLGSTQHQFLIARVQWMPDSRFLAVQRLTRVQNRLDVLAADASTGETRLILREQDPAWVNVSDDLRFLDDGKRFLWSSERDGYRHLYLYSNEGRELRRLTNGAWEVRGLLGVDARTDRVYYMSSETSPLENQLYSVRLNGKDRTRLTQDAGWHTVSMAPGSGYFVDSWSGFENPGQRVLREPDGSAVATLQEPDREILNEYTYLKKEIVQIKAADGRTDLYGALMKPAGFQSGRKYPAIVLVYGGPGAQRIRDQFGGLGGDSGLAQLLAQKGYVVWELDNRGSTGRGHQFESAIYHSLGTVELEDQRAGVDYLTSLGFVDAARIGIYGWSYGGFMTVNAMLNAPGLFRAGIAGAPVTYFANYDTIYTERYMGLPIENPEGYKRTNLPLSAENLKGRLMVIHNINDDNVLFQNTLQLMDALQRAGKQFELMVYPQKSHGVTGPVRRQMLEGMIEFFDRNLNATVQ